MRPMFIALLLLVPAAPALAQPAPPQPDAIQLPPELADPPTAGRLAGAMQSLSHALLDMRVGELKATIEGRGATPAERNLTVRDLGRRDDPQFERHLNERIAAARPRIEQSIKALNQALPEVTANLQQAQRAIERAIANMPDPNYPER